MAADDASLVPAWVEPMLAKADGTFDTDKLVENYAAALDEVQRAKPSAAKGKYVKKITFATTMGPGIPVDTNRTRNLLEDAPGA